MLAKMSSDKSVGVGGEERNLRERERERRQIGLTIIIIIFTECLGALVQLGKKPMVGSSAWGWVTRGLSPCGENRVANFQPAVQDVPNFGVPLSK